MKNECDIVEDLLFSYNDGVLSNTSKELVEQHLKSCEKCQSILEEIRQDNNNNKQIKEIDFFRNIKKKLNKKNLIILIVCIFLVIVILFNVLVYNNYNEVASTMEVYLKDDITEEQTEDIKNKIIENGYNIELEYVPKEKAVERVRNNLEENENLMSNYNNQSDFMSASFEIKTDSKIETMVENIQDMPGISHITTHINSNPYELFIQKIIKNNI